MCVYYRQASARAKEWATVPAPTSLSLSLSTHTHTHIYININITGKLLPQRKDRRERLRPFLAIKGSRAAELLHAEHAQARLDGAGRTLLHGHVGVGGQPEDGGRVARGDAVDDAHVVRVAVIINENDM